MRRACKLFHIRPISAHHQIPGKQPQRRKQGNAPGRHGRQRALFALVDTRAVRKVPHRDYTQGDSGCHSDKETAATDTGLQVWNQETQGRCAAHHRHRHQPRQAVGLFDPRDGRSDWTQRKAVPQAGNDAPPKQTGRARHIDARSSNIPD